MFNLQGGALVFVEQHHSLLTRVAPKLKDHTLGSDRHGVPLMTGGIFDDNNSMKLENLAKEISYEIMGGDVTIISPNGLEHIEDKALIMFMFVGYLKMLPKPCIALIQRNNLLASDTG